MMFFFCCVLGIGTKRYYMTGLSEKVLWCTQLFRIVFHRNLMQFLTLFFLNKEFFFTRCQFVSHPYTALNCTQILMEYLFCYFHRWKTKEITATTRHVYSFYHHWHNIKKAVSLAYCVKNRCLYLIVIL